VAVLRNKLTYQSFAPIIAAFGTSSILVDVPKHMNYLKLNYGSLDINSVLPIGVVLPNEWSIDGSDR
jgi:hypothetical protein